MKRKNVIQGLAAGLSTPLIGSSMVQAAAKTAVSSNANAPKRVIFFLQNQGFETGTSVPKGVSETTDLSEVTLPEPIQDLEPYKDRLNIIHGLHGTHTKPSHSPYFGALGGYRGGLGVAPAGQTIDSKISEVLPQGIFPHLCLGMDSMEAMTAKPTISTLSATGPGEGLYMYSDPNMLYKMLFGSIATDEIKRQYQADTKILRQVHKFADYKGKSLPSYEKERYSSYLNGYEEMNELRENLLGAAGHLKNFMPKYGRHFSAPEFETDWHDALLEIGISVLQSGITNVLTVGSGRGEIFGSWEGVGVDFRGHNLGHMKQEDNPIWIKIRQYNCRMLVKLMKSLEAIPEGNGTMMDNTLIVYTSNNADKQHTSGANWPFMTLGNCSGRFTSGKFYQFDGKRPVNDLYTTLLHAVGSEVDRFNLNEEMALKTGSKVGPIEELLA